MKTSTRTLAAMLLAWLPMVLPAAAADSGTDRIIVKWRSTRAEPLVQQQRMRELAQRLGNPFARGRHLGGSLSLLQLATAQHGPELQQTLAALRADPMVELAEVDERMHVLAYTPSDPLFVGSLIHRNISYDYQWYLKDTQLAAIRANVAWDITHGGASAATSPVVIAVLDTGIRPDHPDLADKLLPGFDFISSKEVANDPDGWDPDPTDTGDFLTAEELQSAAFRDQGCGTGEHSDQPANSTWHGTRVAGLIGASTDNGIGMAGAAFNVRIVPVRVLGKCGGFLSDVIAGMYWAAGFYDDASGHPIPAPLLADPAALRDHPNLHPAQVINMSLGAAGACTDTYATAVRDITAAGVLIVAAAGNDGSGVDKPANCAGVLAVAGLRHSGTKVSYSNLGSEVGIAAPAGNCYFAETPQDPDPPCVFALNTLINLGLQGPGAEGYSTPQVRPSFGTSFSAPLVAATAGLMKSVNPALTPALLVARIKASARPFPVLSDTTPQPAPCLSPLAAGVQYVECICITTLCGAGMLDAGAAVQAALRPAARIRITRARNTITLDGSDSAAATLDGRSIASHVWTVEADPGGAAPPTISNAGDFVASVPAFTQGSVTLLLTITDNHGDSDVARVSLAGTGAGNDGGGGAFDAASLALLLLLFAARRAARAPSFNPQSS